MAKQERETQEETALERVGLEGLYRSLNIWASEQGFQGGVSTKEKGPSKTMRIYARWGRAGLFFKAGPICTLG